MLIISATCLMPIICIAILPLLLYFYYRSCMFILAFIVNMRLNKISNDITIAFWNIDGVHYRLGNQRHSKLVHNDVLDKLANHSIICLAETHCGPNDNIDLDGYSLLSNIRPKSPKATKYSGGLATYVKKSIKQGITFLPITNSEYMWIKLDKSFFNMSCNVYFLLVYICPENSSYAHKRDNIFELIENDITIFSKDGECFVCGDFNARTSSLPDYCIDDHSDKIYDIDIPNYIQDSPIPRRNMDTSKMNSHGNALLDLCKASGLRFLNGRSIGDHLGYYTCYNHFGNPSVIDYMLCHQNLLKNINFFHIDNPTEFSIHCTLSVSIKTNPFIASHIRTGCALESIENQYKWDNTSDNTNFLIALNNIEIADKLSSFATSSFSLDSDAINTATSHFTSILHKTAQIALVRKKKLTTETLKNE